MQVNNINHLHHWQQLLIQAQARAAKMLDMGLNPDKLALLPLDDLLGVATFLKRKSAEMEG